MSHTSTLETFSTETYGPGQKSLYVTNKFINIASISYKEGEFSSLTNLCLGFRAKTLWGSNMASWHSWWCIHTWYYTLLKTWSHSLDKVDTLLQVIYRLAGAPSGICYSETRNWSIILFLVTWARNHQIQLVDILYPIYLSQLLHRTTLWPDEGQNRHITSATVKNLGMTNFIQPSKLGLPLTFSFESRKWCRAITVITL